MGTNPKLERSIVKESLLKNTLILNGILFMIGIGVIAFLIYPDYAIIEAKKNELYTEVQKYNDLSKKGLSFEEIKKQSGIDSSLFDEYGKEFFQKNLVNDTSLSYIDFLNKKEKYVEELQKDSKIALRDASLSKVLPIYEQGSFGTGSTMTDFDFVNYLERLLYTFNLKTTSEIGVGNLALVDSGNEKKSNKKSDTQIFAIPLNFELEGKKSDIIDFLYYTQNVGNIKTVTGAEITFYNDSVIDKVIAGDVKTSEYNIYQNKIFGINSVKFGEYIDTTPFFRAESTRTSLGFVKFIKEGREKNDNYQISLDAEFYVRGLPLYEIQRYVDTIVLEYDKLVSNVNELKTQAKDIDAVKNESILSTIKSIDTYLTDMKERVDTLKSGLKARNNFEVLYKNASEVKFDLENITLLLQKNNYSNILDKNK